MEKRALITGITGQDGSYLAELLLSKGYAVHGLVRSVDGPSVKRLAVHVGPVVMSRLQFHEADLTDSDAINRAVRIAAPTEVYHLASQSHIKVSFEKPEYTAEVVALGTLRLLEAIRGSSPKSRVFLASSSEVYGGALPTPMDETTPFHPRNPYAVAKCFAHWQGVNHREAWGMHVNIGILFNHESPRRSEAFVTRKITRAAARIKVGLQQHLSLGNIDAKRDWGYAGDFVEAMWLMLQQEKPDDYVLATGAAYSVRDCLAAAFGTLDLDFNDFLRIDQSLYRPVDINFILGDPRKAERCLGWRPRHSFESLIAMMVKADLRLAEMETQHTLL